MSDVRRALFFMPREAKSSSKRTARTTGVLTRFRRDDCGSVVMTFAVALMLLVAVAAGAIDFGRWLRAKNATVNAMDAAVLAAGRILQLPGSTNADALAVAEKYYAQNKSKNLSTDKVKFTISAFGTEMVGNAAGSLVKTPFLGLLGIKGLPINSISKAVLAANSNSGSHVELSMMLDTTGSMSGQKMTDLKAAAKDLVDIVVWEDQTTYTSRIALAPFSRYVNVSKKYFTKVTGATLSGTGSTRACVKERGGDDRYTDESPQTGGFFNRFTGSYTCQPTSTILPLTSNKTKLKNRINKFPTSGTTAGHLGTAWAWYLISPKWNKIFKNDAKPLDYSLMSQLNDAGQPKLYKIALLMTDGVYNQKYSGDSSTTQARAVCDNMKTAGVTVYTVGFDIPDGSTPDLTMQHCATSPTHYYRAEDGSALKQAFRDIALKISTLRLAE